MPGGPAAGRAGREGLALSPDAPRKTPHAIPSYLAKAHFFFSTFEDSINRREEEDPMKERAAEPRDPSQVAACSGWGPGAAPGDGRPCDRAREGSLPRRRVHRPRAAPSESPEDGCPRTTEGGGPPCTWRRPAGAPAQPPARQDQWRHLTLKVPPYSPSTPHGHRCPGHGSGTLRALART